MIKRESREYFRALGAHITVLRKDRGMTQADLSRAIGVSQQAIFAYEQGERRPSALILSKLAKEFAISVDDLIGRKRVLPPKHPRLSPRMVRHARRLQELNKTAQRFVIKLIDQLHPGTTAHG